MTSPYDLLIHPADNALPTVAVDLEGTLTAGRALRGMTGYLAAHDRHGEARRYIFRLYPEYMLRRISGRGLREFKNRSILRLLQSFRGYDRDQFSRMSQWAVEHELWPKRRRVVISELEEHRRAGRRVIVVTGLFEPYVAAILERLPGFEAIGTPVVFENGQLTGELATPFNIGQRKIDSLRPFLRQEKIFAAYGDTIEDRYMLAASQEPVVVHPDRDLRMLAERQGWRLLEEAPGGKS